MKINITIGEGHGSTLISAFDYALKDAGVYNYNLIPLSSIVPPNSDIVNDKFSASDDEHGHKLYVVKAEMRSRESGKYIGAAIGWYQYRDNRGVFVEHEAIGETEVAVRSDLAEDVEKSILDLCKARNLEIDKSKIKSMIKVVEVKDTAACALVLAVYKSESW